LIGHLEKKEEERRRKGEEEEEEEEEETGGGRSKYYEGDQMIFSRGPMDKVKVIVTIITSPSLSSLDAAPPPPPPLTSYGYGRWRR